MKSETFTQNCLIIIPQRRFEYKRNPPTCKYIVIWNDVTFPIGYDKIKTGMESTTGQMMKNPDSEGKQHGFSFA